MDEATTPFIHCNVITDVDCFNSYNLNQNNGNAIYDFKILHQNIRSYGKHIDEFLVLLQGIKCKFNCIILTEAWLNHQGDLMHIDGYNTFRSYNNLNQSDGIVVYIDDSLSVSCNQLLIGGVATSLSLTFDWAGATCNLLCVYRSPNTSLQIFNDNLKEFLELNTISSQINVLAGDLNCDIIQTNLNSQEERYLDILSDLGFIACIDKVTRPASKTCIDHFFITLPLSFTASSAVLETEITDHFTTYLELQSTRSKNMEINNCTSKTINWQSIGVELNSFNWNNILNSVDVDEASEMFNKVIGQILDKYTIIENKSAKASKLKPWITNGLLKSIRYRDKLSKQLRHHPFNTQLRARFTRYRNILISLIKKAKYRFYKTKID